MAKYVAVRCKECGEIILDSLYSGPGVIKFRADDKIPCRKCGHIGSYSSGDFTIADGPDPTATDV